MFDVKDNVPILWYLVGSYTEFQTNATEEISHDVRIPSKNETKLPGKIQDKTLKLNEPQCNVRLQMPIPS